MTDRPWNYSRSELVADGAVHAAGIVLASVGVAVILNATFAVADAVMNAAVMIYALSLLASLATSALYSLWPAGPGKWTLRKYDHAAIYLLIAGTYTPFAASMGSKGVWMLAGIWTVALAGAGMKLAFPGRFKMFSIVLYLGLAWSGMLVVETLLESFPVRIFFLLLAGGLIYSAGVPFHLWQTLRFHKAIWHSFVVAAATVHYVAVFLLVLIRNA
ncbi:PAQR family membrane homeostasis protein TrhA [Tianweitania sediminis]|uniref:Hemolysin III family protein n=1 Tax=Tianweitania sediminis TaxID=1502156 RepID=A0A8J7RP90_9HYPH|nr:hemolysin III family protein [Tianweitania sediminis]MBP0439494.1 hemolysin III family protein [Tianweitania sediminis]